MDANSRLKSNQLGFEPGLFNSGALNPWQAPNNSMRHTDSSPLGSKTERLWKKNSKAFSSNAYSSFYNQAADLSTGDYRDQTTPQATASWDAALVPRLAFASPEYLFHGRNKREAEPHAKQSKFFASPPREEQPHIPRSTSFGTTRGSDFRRQAAGTYFYQGQNPYHRDDNHEDFAAPSSNRPLTQSRQNSRMSGRGSNHSTVEHDSPSFNIGERAFPDITSGFEGYRLAQDPLRHSGSSAARTESAQSDLCLHYSAPTSRQTKLTPPSSHANHARRPQDRNLPAEPTDKLPDFVMHDGQPSFRQMRSDPNRNAEFSKRGRNHRMCSPELTVRSSDRSYLPMKNVNDDNSLGIFTSPGSRENAATHGVQQWNLHNRVHALQSYNGLPNSHMRASPGFRPSLDNTSSLRSPSLGSTNSASQNSSYRHDPRDPFIRETPPYMYPHSQYDRSPPSHVNGSYRMYDEFASARQAEAVRYALYGPMPLHYSPARSTPAPFSAYPGELLAPAPPIRSALLEKFKTNLRGAGRFELRDIYNHVVEFSGDQNGSRFIQEQLVGANSEDRARVFYEILPNAVQLMTDVFGNYVIQKFFELGDQTQKKQLVSKMKGQMMLLSTHIYGCRAVQSALQFILVDQQVSLVQELEPDGNIMRCVKDQNGNHVVLAAIEHVPSEHIQFIVNSFTGHVRYLATHAYGCRVVQRLLKYWTEPERSEILREVQACCSTLISDQYGNYVIQYILEHEKEEDRQVAVDLIREDLINLSKQKFASNVVEACISSGSEELRHELMIRLVLRDERGQSPLTMMIRDNYGNYVIQKLLDTLDESNYMTLVEMLTPEIAKAKRLGPNKQAENVARKMNRMDKAVNAIAESEFSDGGCVGDSYVGLQTPLTASSETTNGTRAQRTWQWY